MLLPVQIIDEFRAVALERLRQIEAAWLVLSRSPDDQDQAAAMHREAHNLKGESRLVGFTDINLLCHKVEDLFELARDRKYHVTEDVDLAVTMATRFMAMLVRKKAGTSLGGIDLPGFIRHLDAVIADVRLTPVPRVTARNTIRPPARPRLPVALREQVGSVAVDLFIERLSGKSRRVESAWHSLRELLAIDESQAASPQLEKHHGSAVTLLRELGRTAEVDFEIGDFAIPPEIVAALDVAVLHLLRNAIDHGIEPPEQRFATGRHPTGRVTVRAKLVDEVVTLTVSDDGRGIDYELVRTRGIALGWLDAASGAAVSRDELTRLLLQPGFSTRSRATDLSGRGVGLDAVSAAVVGVGGTVRVDSSTNGTTWVVEIPVPSTVIAAHTFRVPTLDIPFAIRTEWELCDMTAMFVDLVVALGLGPRTPGPVQFVLRRAGKALGFVAETAPVVANIRRIVTTPSTSIAEVAMIDGVEGLLLRPERLQ